MSGHILFLAHRVPWPPDRGDKIRSHHILRKLLSLAPVHLACFAEDEAEAAKPSDLTGQLQSTHMAMRTKSSLRAGLEALAKGLPVSLTSFADDTILDYVRRVILENLIECIFVFSGQMAQYIPEDYTGRIVMDFVDVDSAKFESYGKGAFGPMGWINRREAKLLSKFEKSVAKRADFNLFVSQAETELFHQRSGVEQNKLKPLGNGIDFGFYNPVNVEAEKLCGAGPVLMFTGQMDYRPNVEAVVSFTKEVMPKVREVHPNAVFLIVGRAPTREVLGLNGVHGARVVGPVEDIRNWLKAADIIVAPLRIARGIQNKVLEAMAMAKPVIASSAAAEGINARDGHDFLIAQSPQHESELVTKLVNDPGLAASIAKNARDRICSHYSWLTQLSDLAGIIGMDSEISLMAAE